MHDKEHYGSDHGWGERNEMEPVEHKSGKDVKAIDGQE